MLTDEEHKIQSSKLIDYIYQQILGVKKLGIFDICCDKEDLEIMEDTYKYICGLHNKMYSEDLYKEM